MDAQNSWPMVYCTKVGVGLKRCAIYNTAISYLFIVG